MGSRRVGHKRPTLLIAYAMLCLYIDSPFCVIYNGIAYILTNYL